MTSTRQLAAIMFTDIVGYTALMGADERKAMELVRRNREVQKPLVEKHNGTWLKEMGDGAMSSFTTASDAIHCAMEIQKALHNDNDFNLRIGIHLGEIILEEGDVYGDGVNIASRIESITEPGGIYISDSVQKAIRSNTDIQYVLLGEMELKNVDYPVKTYALRGEFLPRPKKTEEKHLSGRLMAELKRRNVFRAGLAYLALAFIAYSLLKFVDMGPTLLNIIYGTLILGVPISIYLAWNYERSPEGFVRVTSRKAWVNPYSDTQKKPFTGNGVIIVLLIVLLGLVAFPIFTSSEDREHTVQNSTSSFSKRSIAVLPFDNLSNDPEQEYFSDGIQEDILNHLAKIADLNVKSRSSTLRYRSDRPSITQIGADLGVGTILEGSVRKAGNQVRITAQLIDVASDNHIWSETYDRELTEIFTIQSEVAIEIAKVLEIRLTGQQEDLIVNIETENINAYDYLLRAREIRARATEESDYDNALTLLQQAIAVDDQYAEAYAEMGGILYFDKAGNIATSGTTQEIWLDSALSLANKAISLNPNLSYAYLLRSTIYRRPLFQFDKAKQDLQKAYEIDPNDPVILRELSEVLRNEGEYERSAELRIKSIELGPGIKDDEYYVRWGQVYASIGETEHAKELYIQGLKLSPSNPLLLWEMGWVNHTLGDMKESINYFEKAWNVTKGPVFILFMGEINLWMGDFDSSQELLEGVQEAEKALMDSTALLPYRPKLAAVYLKTGRESEAAELLDEALLIRKRNISGSRYDAWTRSNASALIEVGEVLAMQGKADEAIDYLENPINWEWWDPAGALRFLENSPQFDNLRDNARFQALTSKIQEAEELSSAALRKVVNEREASEQMKLQLDK